MAANQNDPDATLRPDHQNEANPDDTEAHPETAAHEVSEYRTIAPKTRDRSSSTPVGSSNRIGRYTIVRLLGKGGFGKVYQARDDELERLVAIKVPHAHLVEQAESAELYLAEARTVAKLDHPNIVPVYDVGSDANYPCYFVSRFVEGSSLAEFVRQRPLSVEVAAETIAKLATALQFAHDQGIVHRDVKPANILVDRQPEPYVVDFGLALREQEFGKGPQFAGTPAYMSPEQARSEGHRVDGRSDVFSLGVVFFELLTGRRPFKAKQTHELLRAVAFSDAPSPRSINGEIPRALERICLRALARSLKERYPSAQDFADDLRYFLSAANLASGALQLPSGGDSALQETDRIAITPEVESAVSVREMRIVPKGLRSFDSEDADFFLELVPGPRDREGLPHSIGFWKRRIESDSASDLFQVGLIYGPSGCGKSSLVKAGLLPSLSSDVISLHLEATHEGTEQRLIAELKKKLPHLPEFETLKDAFAMLRQGQGLPHGHKLLLVIDQSEQWLHGRGVRNASDNNADLVDALRQCDGVHLQCLLLVRDDFWMQVTRLFDELDSRLVEGENSAAVDLLPKPHARKILTAIGRANGDLPAEEALTREQEAFLDATVDALAEDGKVICVRLTLFAEMMKGRRWSTATLREVGGAQGVGVAFLEETFCSATAPPQHRMHERGARQVLQALMPDGATGIKGNLRSRAELQAASEYDAAADGNKRFDELLQLLDRDLRLITPTQGEEVEKSEGVESSEYYQLAHDYLVPSLREWLSLKQRETRRGRAQLMLEERASLWSRKQESQQLPGVLQYVSALWHTKRVLWTDAQRRMMAAARQHHLTRAGILALITAGLFWGGHEINARFQARSMVASLLSAQEDEVVSIANRLQPHIGYVRSHLQQLANANAQTPLETQHRLHAKLALVAEDESQVPDLTEALYEADPSYIGPIRDALRAHWEACTEGLWHALSDPERPASDRFRAAMLLADYEPTSSKWMPDCYAFIVDQLIVSNIDYQADFRDHLRPVSRSLLPALENVYRDHKRPDSELLAAANAVADYAAADKLRIAKLIRWSSLPRQYAILWEHLEGVNDEPVIELLAGEVNEQPTDNLLNEQRVWLGKRRANAAITLLRNGHIDEAMPVLDVAGDPESMTQFIHSCRSHSVQASQLVEALASIPAEFSDAQNAEVRYALLLALSDYPLSAVKPEQRETLIAKLADWYRHDPSSGVHGAARWLLRIWGEEDSVSQVDQTPIPYGPSREWFTICINPEKAGEDDDSVSDLGPICMTFIVFPAGEYIVGSPVHEQGRLDDENQHTITLTRQFAILNREVTYRELAAFSPAHFKAAVDHPDIGDLDLPANSNWYAANLFGRWLTQQVGMPDSEQAYPDPDSIQSPEGWKLTDGRGFRLPTEAEWEIACRAATLTPHFFGSDGNHLGHYAWYRGNSNNHVRLPQTRSPNRRGLYDMLGNLHEWCHDWYAVAYPEQATDPTGAATGTMRCMRGMGFRAPSSVDCRSANRNRTEPAEAKLMLGFRLAFHPS